MDRIWSCSGLDGGKLCDPEAGFLRDQSPGEIQAVQEITLHKNGLSSTFENIHK